MPERSLNDPSSPSYLGNYFVKSIGFDSKIERGWHSDYSMPPALQERASRALNRWLAVGQRSAKFDHAYLLTSVWCADDELVELAPGASENPAEKDLHPLFRAKRNVVRFWRESAALAGLSHPLASVSSPDEVYERHVARFAEMKVPEDDPLPHLLAKAAYSSQIMSTLTSPTVALPNSSKMRANSGISEDSEFMEPQPPSARREAEEDYNLDWFYDLIGCCNPAQSTENSVSPFHPDECEERISSGEVSSPSRQGGFAACVKMLQLQTADLKQALAHFDEALESSFRSICSKKDAVSFDFSLARTLLEMDYGPTTAEQDQSKTQPKLFGSLTSASAAPSLGSGEGSTAGATISQVKPLHQDTKRRDLALACSHVLDPTSVKSFETLMSSCFARSSSATDESYKNCQISYAYQTPRFIEGRISGYASLLRSAAGEKNYLEMFVKRAAYEWELMLNDALLCSNLGGVPLFLQRGKTTDVIARMAHDSGLAAKASVNKARKAVFVAVQSMVPTACALRTYITTFHHSLEPVNVDAVVKDAAGVLAGMASNSLLADLCSRVVDKVFKDLTFGSVEYFRVDRQKNPGGSGIGHCVTLRANELARLRSSRRILNAIIGLKEIFRAMKAERALTTSQAKRALAARSEYVSDLLSFLLSQVECEHENGTDALSRALRVNVLGSRATSVVSLASWAPKPKPGDEPFSTTKYLDIDELLYSGSCDGADADGR